MLKQLLTHPITRILTFPIVITAGFVVGTAIVVLAVAIYQFLTT